MKNLDKFFCFCNKIIPTVKETFHVDQDHIKYQWTVHIY